MSQSTDTSVHKAVPQPVTTTSNKRKRSPTITKSSLQQPRAKKPKTMNTSTPRARPTTPQHINAHPNGTKIKTKTKPKPIKRIQPISSNGTTHHSTTTNNTQQQLLSIAKQKKQLMDPTHTITSSFKGMWKSRQAPQHLLPNTTDTNRGLKRRASGPPAPQLPAKRPKIAPKSQSLAPLNRPKPIKSQATKPKSKTTRDEPPPLVTLNQLITTQKLSDHCLGIKPSPNCLKKEGFHLNRYQTNVLYETALSHIASDQLKNGIYHDQDLDSMIHQHTVLKDKLKHLREDLGSQIPRQKEPIRQESPWDCLLDEVTHVANDIKSHKTQRRLKYKLLSTAIRQKFDKEQVHKALHDKYQDRTRQIEHQMDDRFEMKTLKAGVVGTKVFRRAPNLAIAKMIKTFWNHTFQQWNALKQDIIASHCVPVPPLTFLDGLINLNLDGNKLVDPSWLESIKTDYKLNNVNTNGKVSEVKRAVLLSCRATLLASPPAAANKIKIRGGKLKCKLRDYQFVGLNWLISLYQNKSNGILADDVGSGKTAQIIALFAWLSGEKKINGPHLIIVPGAKVIAWQNQFKTHYPQCKVMVFEKDMTMDYKAKNSKWHACIVSYDLVVRYSIQFMNVRWQYMVLDEAENTHDFSSSKWTSLFRLSCQFRLLLVDHEVLNARQLWSMLYCLAPNAFASKREFESCVRHTGDNSTNEWDRLHYFLNPFMLKRSAADMASLPRIVERQYLCQLTPRQQRLYDACVRRNGDHTWQAIYELQQICNHPNLYQSCASTEQLTEFDAISQMDFVCHSSTDVTHNVEVIAPGKGSDKQELNTIETMYKPLFDKMRDAVTKINKEEKATKMDQSEDSEDTESEDNSCVFTMTNPKTPSNALCKAMSMALQSIIEQKKNKMDQDEEDESLPLHIELFGQYLSQFCAQGLCQWNCSKLNALTEILDDLHSARRHRVVLFVSNERMLNILESFIVVCQYQYVRCGCRESKASTIALINKFETDRDAFIFIMSTRNIHYCQWDQTKADTVIFYEHEWDSVVQDNVYKFIKTIHGGHPLTVYRLINTNTIEHQVYDHFQGNVSQLSVARYYTQHRNVSIHGFNSMTAKIEARAHRTSITRFYDAYRAYNKEFLNDMNAESEQYIDFVKQQLLMKEPNNKLLPKLLHRVGFKPFVHGNVIHYQYKMIKQRLLSLRKSYRDGMRRPLSQEVVVKIRYGHKRIRKSFIEFHEDKKNKKKDGDDEVQILERKSSKPKRKSDKMEMSDDEDDDIKIIDPPSQSASKLIKNKKGKPYTVSSEVRDLLYACDEDGEYYHHLYEPYAPYGLIVNNCNMESQLSSAMTQALKETHNVNNYPMYLDYNYNAMLLEDTEEEEKAISIVTNESDSVMDEMKMLFEQWKKANNAMYKEKGIIPGFLDADNHVKVCPIDPKTNEIIYGSLDDFVRQIGDPHIYRLYMREKLIKPQPQPKEKSVSAEANPPPIGASQSVPMLQNIPSKPKRFNLKSMENKKALEDELRLHDPYYYTDNNVLSRVEDEQLIIRSPDCELPHKVYDNDQMTAFDFEIFKIKQEYQSGSSKNLKQIIEDFKFTPKPQMIHYQDSTSPSPAHEGDSYRLSDAEESTDSEATDKDSVRASSSSSSPMPSHDKIMMESSPSSSANINTLSPNTQRKKALLNSLRVPHSARKNSNNAYMNSNLDRMRDHKPILDDDQVTLSAIHRWIGVRNDTTLPEQKTPLQPFKVEPKKDPKTGTTRYDPKHHPTIFSSKEIAQLHHVVNSFAAKTKGRRNISWRMVKQTLKTKQNINMRCRTRFELLRVYTKTAKQCRRKDFESLSYFGMNETVNLHSKKQKKSKRTTFWDARFTELQEKKGRGNKKQFKEPLDFDDKKLNAMTKKMTKRMVKELDVCISRVVDLTPDNQNKDEHASHQQTIKSAYQKLNLIVQGQKPYAPNYIWKNHWGQLPVNPYTKPNISHPQQAPIHPSSMNTSSHQSMTHVPHPGLRPPVAHPPSASHPASYMAAHPSNPNIPHGHRPNYHPSYYSMRPPHHVPSHHVPSLHPTHMPPGPAGTHPPPIPGPHNAHPYAHHQPSAAHPMRPSRGPMYSMPPYAYPSAYPGHPNAAGASRPPGPAGSSAYPRVPHPYHQTYPPYMSSAGMNPSLARPGVHPNAPPGAGRPRYGTPMGPATAAPQQHSSYTSNRNTQNTNNPPPSRPNTANTNTNTRPPAPNPAASQRPPTNTNTNMATTANANSNPNGARMSNASGFRRPPYPSSTRVGASLAGSGAASFNAQQQRQHLMRQQQQQRQYAAQQSQRNANNPNNVGKGNPNTANPSNNTTLNTANHNVPSQQAYRTRPSANTNNNPNATRPLSQPPRLEQHTTSTNRRPNANSNNAKANPYMNSSRPSLSGTINRDNGSNRNPSSSAPAKPIGSLHNPQQLFKNRPKQFMNGSKKQVAKPHGNTQQNPFGSPNTNKNAPSNALGLPSITDNNSNNVNHTKHDRDMTSNDADRE
eukprot:596342_1